MSITKIEYTSEKLLAIIEQIFLEVDNEQKLSDELNVKYYAFKHRPINTEKVINDMLLDEATTSVDLLMSIKRSFGLFYLNTVERLFAHDNDTTSISATLEYWIQAEKIPILEKLIEKCNISLSGERPVVTFDGDEKRKSILIFDPPSVEDIITESVNGEMAVVRVGVTMSFVPNVITYDDYKVSFLWDDRSEEVSVPLSKFYTSRTMVQKSVPYIKNPRSVGQINLSSAIVFVLSFQGFYDNEFISYITKKALKQNADGDEKIDNNQGFQMKLQRGKETYTHNVIIKDHSIEVEPNTSVEMHVLTLVTRGYIDGTT